MEAGGVRPGPDPFLQAEVVHSSERTRVTRLFLPGRTVIRKEPLGPDADRRARYEAAMLERLLGVAGVAQLAEQRRYPGSVMLEDAGEASLAGMTKPLPVDNLVGFGLGLARAVAGMHQRGVIHRDINSSVPDRVMTKRGTGSWCHSYDPPDRVSWKDSSTTGTGSPIESPRTPSGRSIQPSSNSESPSSPVHIRTQRIIAGLLPTAERWRVMS
jgi:hypothetical protein